MTTRDEDFVVQIFTANTLTPVLFFSTQGLVYKIKAHKIPEGTAASKGKSIFNLLPLRSHHSISSIMPLPEDESEWKKLLVIFVTANGFVRKNSLEDFININVSGKIAMKLQENDKIVAVKICKNEQDILLSTKYGKCIRFMSSKLRLLKEDLLRVSEVLISQKMTKLSQCLYWISLKLIKKKFQKMKK